MKRSNPAQDGQEAWEAALSRELDRALRPGEPPAGMTDRIVQRTRTHLPAGQSILARLGGSPMRMAAAIAIVMGLGATFFLYSNGAGPSRQQPSVASISAQLEQLATIDQTSDTSVDQQISALRAQLATVQSGDPWDDQQDAADDAIAQPVVHQTRPPMNY